MNENKVCRLCLEVILDSSCKRLDDVTSRMLKILPLSLDLSITKDPIICTKCVQELQALFEFKISCLGNNDYLNTYKDSYGSVRLNLEVIIKKEKFSNENEVKENVCRFCLNYFVRNSFVELNNIEQDVFLKDVLEKCFSEIDLNVSENPLICSNCMESLVRQFNFVISCQDNEEKIIYFRSKGGQVNLNDILKQMENLEEKSEDDEAETQDENIEKFDNYENDIPVVMEKEDVEEFDDDFCVEVESFNIKQEHVKEVGVTESTESPNEVEENKSTVSTKIFVCSVCHHRENQKDVLANHYITNHALNMVKLYKCKECHYVTKWKEQLKLHTSKHNIFKCMHCSFKSKYKASLKRHSEKKSCKPNPSRKQLEMT